METQESIALRVRYNSFVDGYTYALRLRVEDLKND